MFAMFGMVVAGARKLPITCLRVHGPCQTWSTILSRVTLLRRPPETGLVVFVNVVVVGLRTRRPEKSNTFRRADVVHAAGAAVSPTVPDSTVKVADCSRRSPLVLLVLHRELLARRTRGLFRVVWSGLEGWGRAPRP